MIEADLHGYSPNTLKSYECCKHFIEFCPEFPINIVKLKLYLLNEAEKGRSFLVLQRIISAINFVCDFLEYPKIDTVKIRKLKRYLRKIAKPRRLVRKGFQKYHLNLLWKNVCRYNIKNLTLIELRTFVMINVLYYTGTRFSCVQNIKLTDIVYKDDFLHCKIAKSKTDQSGEGHVVYVPYVSNYNPIKLICMYLNVNFANPYLFPSSKYDRLNKSWFFHPINPISYSTAYRQFKLFLDKFGLNSKSFGLHSPRIGFTTDLFEKGVPSDVIDRAGRWLSKSTKFGYCKHEETYFKKHIKRFVSSS